jgi:hypothetical protein
MVMMSSFKIIPHDGKPPVNSKAASRIIALVVAADFSLSLPGK